ncbi:MAG: YjjG family noncanonical pyrimidine nucleotidase [Bacteroidota bacterium]
MKQYTHILFDLDHTLWDFDRCATETLKELYQTHQLAKLGCPSSEEFCRVFHQVNVRLWDLYNRGEYDSERLRRERFFLVFDELQLNYNPELPPQFAEEYLAICPTKGYVIPGAIEVLEELHQRYPLHIITNGFSDVQAIKLKHAGLTDYFQTVTTSDKAGYRKPNPAIFQFALEHISATPEICIMIGDNLKTDILGGQNAGIDCVYFNPQQQSHSNTVLYEIQSLTNLLAIL